MKRKRTKQLQEMVDYVNKYLKDGYIKDEDDAYFWVMCDLLVKTHTYLGYNFFVHKECSDGQIRLLLAGSCDKNKYDCLQIY
jgi:hypothetical protein